MRYIAMKSNYLDGLEYDKGTVVNAVEVKNRAIITTHTSTHNCNLSYFLNYYNPLSDYRISQINKLFYDGNENICMDCDNVASYIRHTQFAGSHPYCSEHAKLQSDFGDNDWQILTVEVRDQAIDKIIDANIKK